MVFMVFSVAKFSEVYFTRRNLWLANKSIHWVLLKKRTPRPCHTESAVLDWITKPSYVCPLRIQMIPRTQFRGSGAWFFEHPHSPCFFFFIILEYVLKWYFFSPSNTLHDFCGWGWKSRLPFINPKKTKKWSEKWARFYLEVSRGMLPQKTVKVRITMLISTNSETDFVQLLSPVR